MVWHRREYHRQGGRPDGIDIARRSLSRRGGPGSSLSRTTLIGLLLAAPMAAEGQVVVVGRQATGTVAGTIADARDQRPLPFALIRFPGLGLERFADENGAFELPGIPSGAYQVQLSQPGYIGRDTIVWVDSARLVRSALLMRPAQVDLSKMAPSPPKRCLAPQDDEIHASTELLALLDQLTHNTERYRVLLSAYPFAATYERVFTDHLSNGTSRVTATDSSVMRSPELPRYRPGDIVRIALRAEREQDHSIRFPTLVDLGNPEFRRLHCFTFGGLEEMAGESLARIDFVTAEWVTTPDVDGAVYLDPQSFQVRAMRASLTKIPQRTVDSLVVTTLFREVAPNLSIPTQTVAETWYGHMRRDSRSLESRRESLFLVDIAFFGRAPGSLVARNERQP